jgi:hypothetical protein
MTPAFFIVWVSVRTQIVTRGCTWISSYAKLLLLMQATIVQVSGVPKLLLCVFTDLMTNTAAPGFKDRLQACHRELGLCGDCHQSLYLTKCSSALIGAAERLQQHTLR